MHISECIADLIVKHMRGELSSAESGRLQDWLNSDEANMILFNELMNVDVRNDELREFEEGQRSVWEKINQQIENKKKKVE